MEGRESRAKGRCSIPIATRKNIFRTRSNSKSKKSQSGQQQQPAQVGIVPLAHCNMSNNHKAAPSSLASSQTSFAAGLRGQTENTKLLTTKRGSQTPGWRALLKKTPKSILKRRTPGGGVKTTGHKSKRGNVLKDSTNVENNKRHVSLKLDFGDEKTVSTSTKKVLDCAIISMPNMEENENINPAAAVEPASTGKSKVLTGSCVGNETDKMFDDSILSDDIQSLSMDKSDSVKSKENHSPETSQPEIPTPTDNTEAGKMVSSCLKQQTDDPISTTAGHKALHLKQTESEREDDRKKDGHMPVKTQKSLSRSATFTNGTASKRNLKQGNLNNNANKHRVGYSGGIRKYSDLKRSEEELQKKTALLEAKLMESSMRIQNLGAALSEAKEKLDEAEHENFELREELESKEQYYIETMEENKKVYTKENNRLLERIEKCVEKLIVCKIDPVTLEPMEQRQADKEEFIKARLEAKVQCKIFQQKLESFIRCSEERFDDITSNRYESSGHEVAREKSLNLEDEEESLQTELEVTDSHEDSSDDQHSPLTVDVMSCGKSTQMDASQDRQFVDTHLHDSFIQSDRADGSFDENNQEVQQVNDANGIIHDEHPYSLMPY